LNYKVGLTGQCQIVDFVAMLPSESQSLFHVKSSLPAKRKDTAKPFPPPLTPEEREMLLDEVYLAELDRICETLPY